MCVCVCVRVDVPWGMELDMGGDTESDSGTADADDQSADEPAAAGAAADDAPAAMVTPRLSEPLLRRTLHTLLANWEVQSQRTSLYVKARTETCQHLIACLAAAGTPVAACAAHDAGHLRGI